MNNVAHKSRRREETEAPKLKRKEYEQKLRKLYIELVKMRISQKRDGGFANCRTAVSLNRGQLGGAGSRLPDC